MQLQFCNIIFTCLLYYILTLQGSRLNIVSFGFNGRSTSRVPCGVDANGLTAAEVDDLATFRRIATVVVGIN